MMLRKRIFQITSLTFIIAITIIVYSYIAFNTYAPHDGATIDEALLEYYSENYTEARNKFISATKDIPFAEHSTIHISSAIDSELYTDICYIPPKGAAHKLVILTSGLHGIEAYTGSALQLLFLEKMAEYRNIENTGFLFIHALNPFGFKYGRKVTEAHVDLNRNCVLDEQEYGSLNPGFTQMYDMLTPAGEVNVYDAWYRSFHLVAIRKIIQESMGVLRQAALQGQYQYPEGIYYGGTKYEPQIDAVMPVIKSYINRYREVLAVDLHTGYGQRGQLHLFIDRPDDIEVEQGIETVFAGAKIDWSEGADFYTINGEFLGLLAAQADSALVIPMLMEFGTMNSQTTLGSLKSIQIMIAENQGANNGYASLRSEQKVKADMMELYCPQSAAWRCETVRKADAMFDLMMNGFTSK